MVPLISISCFLNTRLWDSILLNSTIIIKYASVSKSSKSVHVVDRVTYVIRFKQTYQPYAALQNITQQKERDATQSLTWKYSRFPLIKSVLNLFALFKTTTITTTTTLFTVHFPGLTLVRLQFCK